MAEPSRLNSKVSGGILLVCILLFSGCANKQHGTRTGNQCPAEYQRNFVRVDPVFLEDLQYVKNDIVKYSGTNAELLIVAGSAPNAYTWVEKNKKIIAINLGLIKILGENFDEYAFVISHELAHVSQGHINKKKSYNKNIQQTGGVLGLAIEVVGIGLGIPFSGLISSATVNSGTHLAKMGYSRDQERKADELGVEYMKKAGFDPWGAVSFQQKLEQFSKSDIAFLSTHPQTEERIENLKKLIKKNSANK